MLPLFDAAGNLPEGIYWPSWDDFVERFGTNSRRLHLISGLREALLALQKAGCRTVYIDGSFVTAKALPGDFDGCWDPAGINIEDLDPTLLDFSNKRAAQKMKYGGELFVAGAPADLIGRTFLEFFQRDRSGNPKGIVAFALQRTSL